MSIRITAIRNPSGPYIGNNDDPSLMNFALQFIENGVVFKETDVWIPLALADHINSFDSDSVSESNRILIARVTELESAFDKISAVYGEEFYSWQRTLRRTKETIHRRDCLAEVVLNMLGWMNMEDCVIPLVDIRNKAIKSVSPIVPETNGELPPYRIPLHSEATL